MSGFNLKILRHAGNPEFLTAQSQLTALSELILAGPVSVHGIIVFTPGGGVPTRFFDGLTEVIDFGNLSAGSPDARFILGRHSVRFESGVGLVRTVAATVTYTIFYSE